MPAKPVRKAVFPAAGLGTRFLPATKSIPKEMLPLVDRPIIQYGVEEVVAAGVTDVTIVTAHGKSAIEDHFDEARLLESLLEAGNKQELLAEVRHAAGLASIGYVRQKRALGLGHAVLVARPMVGDEPFAVVLCDDVVRADPGCTAQLLEIHRQTGASVVCIEEVERERTASYGIVAGDDEGDGVYRLRELVEKPHPDDAPSNLAIIGRYILTPKVFDKLEQTGRGTGGEIQLTDAINKLLEDEPVYAYRFRGKRYDAGSKLGFLQATVEFALGREDLEKPFGDYLRALAIDPGGAE